MFVAHHLGTLLEFKILLRLFERFAQSFRAYFDRNQGATLRL